MIKNLCHELGVLTEPMRISGVWIAPIYSWYHASFDREPDLPGAPAVEKVGWQYPDVSLLAVVCVYLHTPLYCSIAGALSRDYLSKKCR